MIILKKYSRSLKPLEIKCFRRQFCICGNKKAQNLIFLDFELFYTYRKLSPGLKTSAVNSLRVSLFNL